MTDDTPDRARENPPSDRPPELVDEVSAVNQSRADRAEDLVPVAFAQAHDALRLPRPDEVFAAVVNLVRGDAAREVVRAALADYGEQYRAAIDRAEDLHERLLRDQRECLERRAREQLEWQETLGRERQEHAVTKTNLRHAGTRTAGQTVLQILGGGFFGWGLSQIGTSWFGLAYLVIALVMIGIGCLPLITIPWWRGSDG